VDLHPLNLDMLKSFVIGVHGDQQVGVGFTIGGGVLIDSPPPAVYALLWRGTADSVLNLNPVGYLRSRALATSGKQQVGWASKLFYHGGGPDFPIFSAEPIPIGDEAILWSGTAESAITLHPSSWGYSRAYGVANGEQVGYGGGHSSADEVHALHWRGSAESVIDLHTFLPPEYSESFARGINDNGDVVGGAILRSNPQQFQAVLWKRQ